MAIAAVIAAIAGAVAGAADATVQRKAAKEEFRAHHYDARLAEIRGSMLRQQAALAKEQGNSVVARMALEGADALASARGSYAAGNVQLGTGSAGAYELDSAEILGQDLAAQKHLTAIDVWAFEQEADQEDFRADWTRDYADRAWQMGKTQALIGTFRGAGQGFSSYQQAGGKTGPSSGGQSMSQSSASSSSASTYGE